jgi:hypothetical protein
MHMKLLDHLALVRIQGLISKHHSRYQTSWTGQVEPKLALL